MDISKSEEVLWNTMRKYYEKQWGSIMEHNEEVLWNTKSYEHDK